MNGDGEAPGSDDSTSAFERLAPGLQRKLWDMKWAKLRAVQAHAIRAYCDTDRDLLIMADTAGGKTEAAFLPVLSEIAELPEGSVHALYVGPLKALINDQFGRVEDLCGHLSVPVHRWHGDVGANRKQALIDAPRGVLLITPESLEALLIRRTRSLPTLFAGLRAIVIDELHSFLENERGLHLRSLLTRLAAYYPPGATSPRRVRTIGLSATIGDVEIARRFLNQDAPEHVAVIADTGGPFEIQMRVHAYLESELSEGVGEAEPAPSVADDEFPPTSEDSREDETVDPAGVDSRRLRLMAAIAKDLVEHCRGAANLIFANSKGDIELYADLANEECERAGLPESFLVHHGSLARDIREDTEATMKDGLPLTTVCSSTLEMGIDIGSVRMVGQIGAPWSVASLRQRAGRSGRKPGEVRRLRIYCDWEDDIDPQKATVRQLPLELVQSIAACELMLKKWLEPPRPARLDLSTLTHQTISLIKQRGAVTALELHEALCQQGPFRGVGAPIAGKLLRDLAARDVVEQGPDGRLILGLQGERIVDERDFYAAFASQAEYTVIAKAEKLGTLPLERLPQPGDHLIFAGRRWQVVEIDDRRKVLYVTHARRRRRPTFISGPGDVHPEIRETMRAILERDDRPRYLTPTAQTALDRAREMARTGRWSRRSLVETTDHHTLWLTWTGTAAQRTLLALLEAKKIETEDLTVAIRCRRSVRAIEALLAEHSTKDFDAAELAKQVKPLARRKFDHLLGEELLRECVACDRLDVEVAKRVILQTIGGSPEP